MAHLQLVGGTEFHGSYRATPRLTATPRKALKLKADRKGKSWYRLASKDLPEDLPTFTLALMVDGAEYGLRLRLDLAKPLRLEPTEFWFDGQIEGTPQVIPMCVQIDQEGQATLEFTASLLEAFAGKDGVEKVYEQLADKWVGVEIHCCETALWLKTHSIVISRTRGTAGERKLQAQVYSAPSGNGLLGDRSARREAARNIIRGLALMDGKTVGQLFDEMNANLATNIPLTPENVREVDTILTRHAAIREALRSIGLFTISAEPEMELDVVVYGGLWDSNKLLKALPQLKAYQDVLAGITF